MKICLISQEYPPETNWGGIATYTQVLARQLVQMGHRVHVVALAEGEEKTADDCGAVVHRVSRVPKSPFDPAKLDELNGLNHGLLYFSQRVYEKVQEIHEKEPLDVIEAPETCAQALLVFKRIDGVRKITRCHTPFFWVRHLNAMEESPDHLTRDALEKLQTECSTAVTSPTFAMAEVIKNGWGIDSTVIPNFFNLKTYTPDTSVYEKHLAGSEYFLFYGRLEYRKGVHVLAAALPEILRSRPGVTAVLVGSDSVYNSGSMKSYIQEQTAGFEDRVTFIDNIPHAALYPLIEKAKFVVLPSLWENFPYACMEGMSLGKTVVASNAGGFPEIIKDGEEGILCKPGDVDALTAAITSCFMTDVDRIGDRARKKAEVYDTEKVCREMLDFYRAVPVDAATKVQGEPPLKVGYLRNQFPLPSETFVINEIVGQQRLGVDVYPISLFDCEECQLNLMSRIARSTYNLSKVNRQQLAEQSPFFRKAKQLVADLELSEWLAPFAACIADFVRQHDLKLLHAHFATESALVAMVVSELTGVPFTFTVHAYDLFIENEGCPGERLDRRLKLLVERASRVIAISEFNKRYLAAKTSPSHAGKMEVIRCGINTDEFTPVDRSPSDAVTFFSVGRFVEKKGHEFLLQAFKRVIGEVPGARLRLAGDGPLKPEMMKLCAGLDLEKKVEFLGAIPSELVLEEMKRCDIFVLHSVTAGNGDMEGVPVSLMEASATALPVISTTHSGIPELVVHDVTGLLGNERDVDQLVTQMVTLAKSPALRLRLGTAGREYVRQKYDQSVEAAKLRMVFEDAARPADRSAGSPTPVGLTPPPDGAKMHKPDLPFVSIVIPVFNGEATLDLCLHSISQLSYPSALMELIVIDNGSTDSSVEIAKKYNAKVLHEPTIKSSYAARNVGIGVARGELIAFTDADCIVTRDWLKHLVTDWHDATIGCFAGEIEAYQPADPIEVFSDRAGILRQNGTLTCPYLPYTQTANSAYRKAVFDKVGLFHPDMTSGGDADIAWRMQKQLGLKIKFVPEALVYHKHRTSLQGLYNQFKKYEHGKLSWTDHYSDYELATVEQRKQELDYWIDQVRSCLSPDTERFVKEQIDFADLLSPFFRFIMSLGTFKARTEIENNKTIRRASVPAVSIAPRIAASVIICTYNRSALLADSLRAIVQQDLGNDRYEIIVVDNNSTDDTRAVTESVAASSPVAIRYIFEQNQGLSFARNAGIRNAEGEIVAFVDDDIDADASWLAAIVKAFDDGAVACAGGPIRPVWPGKKPEWLSEDWVPYLTINEFEAARRAGAFTWPDTPWGANISFRKSVFDRVGLFPTDLGRIGTSLLSNEEVNICKKIAEAGLKIAFAPEAVIHHKIAPERITKQWFYHRTYWQGRSDAILDANSGASIYAGIAERTRRYASAARDGQSGSFYARCARRVALGYLYQATLAVKPSFRALIGYLCAQADASPAEQLPTAATREFPGTQSLSGRGILVVDYEVPQFDKYAGSRTTFMYLKLLAGLGMQVYFMPDDFEKRDPYGDALEKLGIKVLHGEWFRNNWRQWIRNNSYKLHYVLFNRPNITVNYIDFVKANTRSVILFQGHDLHYLRLSRKYEVDGDIEALKEADEYQKIEFDIIEKSDVILTFSEYERQVLAGHFPAKPVYSVPLFFYDQFPGPGADFRERKDIMFVGGCGHKPNLDAILWFANEVFPKVLEKVPDMVFHVIGTYPPQEVRDLASDRIKVAGHVSEEELEEYYRSIKTVVIPLRFGAGVKGKTIEALYRGVPLVSTAIGLEGIPGIGTAVRPADTAEDFAAELIALYQDDGRLEVTSALYREYAKSYLHAGNARNILAETLLRVAAPELAPEPKVEVPRTIHLPGQKSPRLIAFYLPQYHPIPENDEWWGKGFTEWRNVAKAKPLFPGHYQPHIPADLGFYDLRLDETRIAQAELAREHGIGGFCYYHYWFNGKRLLEKPVESMLASGKPDFPFCVCWANENWTRTWDGEERNVLMQQKYSEEDDRRHIRSLFATFEDSRYIRIDGKPLFLVYRTENLPDPNRTAEVWREEARKAGIGELYLARVEGLGQIDPRSLGFDAGIEFAPDWKRKGPRLKVEDLDINKWLLKHGSMAQVCEKNYIHRYESLADNMRRKQAPDFPWLRCVTPSWDNSARRTEGANIFVGSTPEKYQQWLTDAIEQTVPIGKDQEKVVFINAWNEWAEGNHLEPDQMHGRAYLEATRNAVISASLGNGFIRQDVDAEALRQMKQRVSAQEWQIIELDRMLVAKEQVLSEREGIIAERERIISERERRIEDLLNSASWKATGFLRWGYEKILALKGS